MTIKSSTLAERLKRVGNRLLYGDDRELATLAHTCYEAAEVLTKAEQRITAALAKLGPKK
jgi:hypothetical protein